MLLQTHTLVQYIADAEYNMVFYSSFFTRYLLLFLKLFAYQNIFYWLSLYYKWSLMAVLNKFCKFCRRSFFDINMQIFVLVWACPNQNDMESNLNKQIFYLMLVFFCKLLKELIQYWNLIWMTIRINNAQTHTVQDFGLCT